MSELCQLFQEICEKNTTSSSRITLMRQYRHHLSCIQTQYDTVKNTINTYCTVYADGAGFSQWYLYNYNGTLMVLDRCCYTEIPSPFTCRPAPLEWDFIQSDEEKEKEEKLF